MQHTDDNDNKVTKSLFATKTRTTRKPQTEETVRENRRVLRKKRAAGGTEREVTCVDWGSDTTKNYWKWDLVVPDACWREYTMHYVTFQII